MKNFFSESSHLLTKDFIGLVIWFGAFIPLVLIPPERLQIPFAISFLLFASSSFGLLIWYATCPAYISKLTQQVRIQRWQRRLHVQRNGNHHPNWLGHYVWYYSYPRGMGLRYTRPKRLDQICQSAICTDSLPACCCSYYYNGDGNYWHYRNQRG